MRQFIIAVLDTTLTLSSASTHALSYGWRRTELLGGLFNGLFLLSMALYVALQSVPEFIHPKRMLESQNTKILVSLITTTADATEGGAFFISIASVGIAVNFVGMLLFMRVGGGHGHRSVIRVTWTDRFTSRSHGAKPDEADAEEEDYGHSHSKVRPL